jgi:hypothetical protein
MTSSISRVNWLRGSVDSQLTKLNLNFRINYATEMNVILPFTKHLILRFSLKHVFFYHNISARNLILTVPLLSKYGSAHGYFKLAEYS